MFYNGPHRGGCGTTSTTWIGFFRFHGLLASGSAATVVAHRDTVWDANRPAREQGVRPGMSLPAARVACPTADRLTFDPVAGDRRLTTAWDLLAEASSVVEPDADGRPEAHAAWPSGAPPIAELKALQERIGAELPHVDLAAGLAGTALLARLACPQVQGTVRVDPARAAEWIAPRPLRDLVDLGLIRSPLDRRLADLGLRCCGQVAALPEPALMARFGHEGRRLHRLCQGLDGRPIRSLHPPRSLAAHLSPPDDLPGSARAEISARLARQAAGGLHAGEGVGCLSLHDGLGTVQRTFRVPCRDHGTLARAAATLAAGRTGAAGRIEVRLEQLASLPATESDLFERRVRPDLDPILERLPQGMLRRGWGRIDRHEALLAMLDPWRAGR